jgi:hypothetical protein
MAALLSGRARLPGERAVGANGGDTVPTSAAARTDSPTEPGTRRRADMLAYNLFRHRGEHDLFCAVPEDFAVPAFLSDEAWEFTGKVDEPDTAPADLDLKTATTAVRLNGCYFFEPLAGR